MGDDQHLRELIETGRSAIDDFLELLGTLDSDEWDRATDLPGWTVADTAAHVAHLESVLAGTPDGFVVPEGTSPAVISQEYTEHGVQQRRRSSPRQLIDEIRDASARRFEALEQDPPTSGDDVPPTLVPVEWSWWTILRNRPLDVWMHEQDIRRAVGRTGGLHSRAAEHTIPYLAQGFGYVLARRAGAEPGTTAVLRIDGFPPMAYRVDDRGRGLPLAETPEEPTVSIRLDRESYIVLAGGRRQPAEGAVVVAGDASLGQRILSVMATTP